MVPRHLLLKIAVAQLVLPPPFFDCFGDFLLVIACAIVSTITQFAIIILICTSSQGAVELVEGSFTLSLSLMASDLLKLWHHQIGPGHLPIVIIVISTRCHHWIPLPFVLITVKAHIDQKWLLGKLELY